MNRLRLIFQLSVAILLCLSAATFALAEENPLAAATLPLAVFCWLVIDRPDRNGIGGGLSVLLGVASLAAAILEFARGGIESRLLAPAHLLVYLMWLFLLQRKQPRHYWMLLGLCVLQVAVASVLTNAAWFGLALTLIAVAGLWTLGVFTLYRAVLDVQAEPFSLGGLPAEAAAAPDRLRSARSSVRKGVHLEPDERLIGAHFAGGAAAMIVVSLAVSALFFLLVPRIWIRSFRLFDDSPIAGGRPLTGFTEQVTLGDMGEILENADPVMQLEFLDPDTGGPLTIRDEYDLPGGPEPLIRGVVLEGYGNGRWSQLRNRGLGRPRPVPPEGARLARQRIRLEPIGTPTLFSVGQALTVTPHASGERIEFVRHAGIVQRHEDEDVSVPFRYEALASLDPQPIVDSPRTREYVGECLRLPAGVEEASRLAHERLERAPGGPPPRAEDAARWLESWLRDSGDFQYSLDLSIDDPALDPVVDFLVNRQSGHCEYFASALAVMLRGVGIPSRMVSGFKGGGLDAASGRLEVRQLHAHAWVEALVETGWIALDPTPEARAESVALIQARTQSVWSSWREAWERTWNSGIRLSKSDQDELVYRPIRDSFSDLWESLSDARGTAGGLAGMFRSLFESPEKWFSWRGGLAVFLLLSLAAGGVWLVRRLWTLLRSWRSDRDERGRGGSSVEFYERFQKLAARAGLERDGPQTQREFAAEMRRRLASRLAACDLQQAPELVTDEFYRVRFGSLALSSQEQQSLLERLDALEQCLAPPDANGRPRRGLT